MKSVTYVTGNPNKARYFAKMVGLPITHQAADIDEIQSLDVRAVAEHKVRAAYNLLGRPVVVDDTFLIFKAFGELPGPFIKWFEQEIGFEHLCNILTAAGNNAAVAGAVIAYFDGDILEIFYQELRGVVPPKPRGNSGFGWNEIFIPEGSNKTLGEMSEEEFEYNYKKIKPFGQLREYLVHE